MLVLYEPRGLELRAVGIELLLPSLPVLSSIDLCRRNAILRVARDRALHDTHFETVCFKLLDNLLLVFLVNVDAR